ncbi:hypothetical protein PG997_011501 [Apiospora hydei]|uniref:Uncharacterized protein n=1 Tax=Apiospora hydei TaxID=1337664 RepID=A0ABR1VN64_9PEZI
MTRITVIQASLMGLELLFSIATFALFCTAYPDHYRTRLWSIGGEMGWNSNPRLRVYFFANYEDPPEIPPDLEPEVVDHLKWRILTDSALAIATLSLVLCISRMALSFYSFMMPAFGILYDAVLAACWYYSVNAQSSGDLSDSEHISIRPCILHLIRLLLSLLNIAYWCGEKRVLDGFTEKVSLGLINSPDNQLYQPLVLHEEMWDDANYTVMYMGLE